LTANQALVLDVSGAEDSKNTFWTGFARLQRRCSAERIALVLAGINERLASRLEEYAALDERKITSGSEWVTLCVGDDSILYWIGVYGKDQSDRAFIAGDCTRGLKDKRAVGAAASTLLIRALYLDVTVDDSDNGTVDYRIDLDQVRDGLCLHYGSML